MLLASFSLAINNSAVEQIYAALKDVSTGSILIPILFCFLKRKALNATFRALLIYLILTFLLEILSHTLAGKVQSGYLLLQAIFQLSNSQREFVKAVFAGKYYNYLFALSNAFTLIQFFTFIYIYYQQFTAQVVLNIIKVTAITYLVFSIVVLLFFKNFMQPDNLTTVVEGCIAWTLSIYFFYTVLKEMTIPKLTENSFIWLNAAILIYFSVSLVLFLADEYLETCSSNIFKALWSQHLLAHITFNVPSSVGIWKQKNLE